MPSIVEFSLFDGEFLSIKVPLGLGVLHSDLVVPLSHTENRLARGPLRRQQLQQNEEVTDG